MEAGDCLFDALNVTPPRPNRREGYKHLRGFSDTIIAGWPRSLFSGWPQTETTTQSGPTQVRLECRKPGCNVACTLRIGSLSTQPLVDMPPQAEPSATCQPCTQEVALPDRYIPPQKFIENNAEDTAGHAAA